MVLTIKESRLDTVVVLGGGGYSAGAERWLRRQAGKDCLLHVFNMEQLQAFCNDGRL